MAILLGCFFISVNRVAAQETTQQVRPADILFKTQGAYGE
jgi:hypothetical protein